MRVNKHVLAVVFMAAMLAFAMPATAASTVIASEHTTASELGNGTTLEDWTVKGSGESGYLLYSSKASYASGASAHWTLDQNEKPAVDEINGLNATFTNSPTYTTGLVGSGAVKFQDADNDALAVSEPFDPTNTNSYTLHARAKATTSISSDSETIVMWDGGVIIRFQDGEMRYYHKDGSNAWQLVASPVVSSGTIYDVGLTWNGSTVTAYLNGSKVGSASYSGVTMGASTNTIAWGDNTPATGSTNDFALTGVIDEPRIWKNELSSTQMSTLHNDPSARLGSSGTDGYATYVSAAHNVSQATAGKVNISKLNQATAYVEWQYYDGSSWLTHTNTSYTTTGVKTADLSSQAADKWRVKVHVTDGDKNGKVAVQGDWVTFKNNAPAASNLDPQGTLNSQSPTFTVDINDSDFATPQGDSVNASLYVSGEYRGSDTLTANGTAGVTTKTTGSNTYHWVLADAYGGTTTTGTVNITTPEILYVFQETAPHNLVNNVQVNATVTGSGGTVELSTVGDGKISLAGLPTGQSYVFTINAKGYHPREVYINDLFDQQSVYLLNKSAPNVQNTLTINDRTGQYGDGTIIIVEKVINTSTIEQIPNDGAKWVTIGGDRLGTSGFYVINLQQYGRYRFIVRSPDGNVRVLGEYTAKASGKVNLQIGTIKYTLGPGADTYQWDASLTNVTGGNYSLTFAYTDHQGITKNVTVTFKTRGSGTVLATKTFTNGGYGEVVYTYPVSESMYKNKSFVVEWSAERNGTVITGKRLVAGKAVLNYPISDMWKSVAFGAGVLILAFLIGAGVGPAPALITTGLFGAFGVYIGLAPAELGFGATALVLMMGGIHTFKNARTPG